MAVSSKRVALTVAVAGGFVLVSLAGLLVAQRTSQPSTAGAAGIQGESPESAAPREEATSSVVTVAAGTEAGADWELLAYTADVDGLHGPTDALCLSFEFPSRAGNEYVCHMDYQRMLEEGTAFGPIAHFNDGDAEDPPRSAFFGPTSTDTRSVEVSAQSRGPQGAGIYGPFDELGGVKFFVGFAPPLEEAEVVGRDASGAALWRHSPRMSG